MESARGLVPRDHLCWPYVDAADYRARAAEFIADGLRAGEWIAYIGDRDSEALRTELSALDGGERVLATGTGGVTPARDFYTFAGGGEVIDPERTIQRETGCVNRVLDAGFGGFRALVDATPLVRTPEQREAFARYEHLVDRQVTRLPASAMCLYDACELGRRAVAELACLHPLVRSGATAFTLSADPDADLALGGSLDSPAHELFATSLDRLVPDAGHELIVDGRAAEFIDHRSLLMLGQLGRRTGTTVAVRSPRPGTRRMIEILDVAHLRASA